MKGTSILVLRHGVHGMSPSEYVRALEARLDGVDVRRARTPQEERELVEKCEVATGIELDDSVLDAAERLKLFACAYAGTDHLPMDTLRQRGIAVTNASGVHGPNVSEYVLGAILSYTRGFRRAGRQQERREWRHFQARELKDATVTVVGHGAIGAAVIRRLRPFEVDTIGVRHSPEKGGLADEIVGYNSSDLHAALARTDHLVLACPLTDRTRGLIDHEAFLTLPSHAFLVNVARGPVVDTHDLMEALGENEISAAALDVTDPEPLPEDHPLWGYQNVLITPHNAGHTPKYYQRLADILADNLKRVEETDRWEGLRNQVS